MHRLLPVAVILILLVVGIFNFTSLKRSLVYKLGVSGDSSQSCCSEKDVLSSSGIFDESAASAIFNSQAVDYPKTSLAYAGQLDSLSNSQVLGTETPVDPNKWIEIDLAHQMLRAWNGNQIVMEYPISSGLWFPTPKGDFHIWYKTLYQRMVGGSKELHTFYDLPNVPYNMFFYKGYAIHGAYWHNNFGHPMSHGCVNEPIANAAALFQWAGPVLPAGKNAIMATADNPGTRVFVH